MVSIRRARAGDIAGITFVLAKTWRDTYSAFLPEASIAKITSEWHPPEIIEAELDCPSTFAGVATVASGIVGMITAHSRGEILHIARLYVLPAFQRRGIGERLMEESYRAFPGTRRVQLEVEEQNPKARKFYGKLGFREVDVKSEDVAGTQLNSIVMEKQIPDAA